MAQTDVQKDRCRNCGGARPPAGSHANGITVGLQKCAQGHTMTRPAVSACRTSCVHIYFFTLLGNLFRWTTPRNGSDWRREEVCQATGRAFM